MNNNRLYNLLMVSVFIITGCSTESYVLPQGGEPVQNEITVDAGIDETWNALVSYASGTFFGIDNFEKSSGLMTLSFSSDAPYELVDCGNFNIDGLQKFNGNYAQWIWMRGGNLNGRMNIIAQEETPGTTVLRIDTRYVITYPTDSTVHTWSFDTNGRDTKEVYSLGNRRLRACMATGLAEKQVIEGVQAKLEM